MNEDEKFQFEELKRQVEDLRFQLARKTGSGSSDIKGNIINPSTVAGSVGSGSISSSSAFVAGVVDQAAIGANAVGDSELKQEEITVNVSAGQTVGTGTCTSGSVIIGWRPAGNVDQFVDDISVSGTVVTVTLGAAATAQNNFVVILIKA